MNNAYEFGAFRLNIEERSIENAGRPVALAPKALEVLMVLVENRGRIVDRDDLMKKVWPDTFVEDNNLAFNISVLRKLFGESATSPRYIETVPKRGYRFVAEVHESIVERAERLPAAELLPETMPWRSWFGPYRRLASALLLAATAVVVWHLTASGSPPGSLAVLPFRALDAASADDSLEVGLTDALITRLSRSLSIPVRPMSSMLRYRDRRDDPSASGRALGVELAAGYAMAAAPT